jgi:hypothetical protein
MTGVNRFEVSESQVPTLPDTPDTQKSAADQSQRMIPGFLTREQANSVYGERIARTLGYHGITGTDVTDQGFAGSDSVDPMGDFADK